MKGFESQSKKPNAQPAENSMDKAGVDMETQLE